MDTFSLQTLLLISLATSAIIGISIAPISYKLIKLRLTKLIIQASIAITQYKLDNIEKQIIEVKKYKNDHDLFTSVALQEVLWQFWGLGITCIAVGIYFIFRDTTIRLISYTYPLYLPISPDSISMVVIVTWESISLYFFWRHLHKSFSRLLFHYRIIRDIVDYDEFIKRKTNENKYLRQKKHRLWRALAKSHQDE